MADFQTVTKTVKIVTDASGAKAGGQEAQAAFESLDRSIAASKEHLEALRSGFESAVDKLKEFAAVVGVGFTVEKIYEFTEAWEKANYQIEAVTGSAEAAGFAMGKLLEASQRSRTAIDGNAETFSRLLVVQDQLGASQQDLAKFTESVSTAMALMGKGSDATAGLVGNFTRSLASGTVGTREFRTILADTPQLAEAMAQHIDGAGGSIQRLRDMMAAGKVSSQEFFQAIVAALPEMQSRLSEIPATVSQATTQLENALKSFMGHFDETTGATRTLADSLQFLADHLDAIVRVAGIVGVAMLAAMSPAILGGIGTAIRAVAAGWEFLTAAMYANPFVAVAAIIATAAAALYLFRNSMYELGGINTTVGNQVRAVWEVVTNSVQNAVDQIVRWATIAKAIATLDGPALTAALHANADAMGRSTDLFQAQNDQIVRTQLESAHATDAVAELTEGWEKHGAALNTSTDATQKQIDAFKKLADSLDPVRKALDDYSKREEEIETGRKLHLGTQAELLALQSASFDQLILETRAAQDKVDVIGTTVAKLQLETEATRLELIGRKDLADALKIEFDLRQKLVAVTPEQIKAIQDATAALELEKKALKDHQTEQDNAAKAARKAQDEIARVSQETSDKVVDAFVQMAEGSKSPFDALKSYALKIFEEIAAAAIIRPIIQPMIASAVGAFLPGAAAAATGGALGGAGSAGLFGAAGASAAGWLNGIGASSGMFGMGGSASVAANGFAMGAMPGMTGLTGTAPTGILGGTAGLTSVLGAGALGAIGGNILAGLLGENKTGGSIGGGIGAAIGMMTPLGPLGALLGGALGSVIGGLFGGHPSNNTGVSNIDLASNTLTSGAGDPRKVDQTNISGAQNIGSIVSQITGAFSQIAGADAQGRAYFEVGQRDGIHANVNGADAHFDDSASGASSAISFAVKQIAQSFGSKLPPEIATAMDHVDFSDVTKAVSDLSFAANFRDNLKAMTGGVQDFKATVSGAAAEAIKPTVAAIQNFMDTTKRLGLDTDAAAAATKQYVEQLIGLAPMPPKLSALQTAFQTLDGTLEGLKPLLDEVGISFDDAAAAVQAAKDKLKSDYGANLQTQIDQAKNPFLKTLSPLFQNFVDNIGDANQLGLGGKLQELLRSQLDAAVSGMNANDLQSVIDYYKTISGGQVAVDAATAALARLNGTAGAVADTAKAAADAQQALTKAANDNFSAVSQFLQSQTQLIANFKQQADAWSQVSAGLGGAAAGLLTNSTLSPLSPGDRFGAAEASYNALKARIAANPGDLAAAGQLGQASNDYLTAARAYFGGGADYYSRFAQVQATLQNTKTVADVQMAIAQQQAASLQTQVDLATKELNRLDELVNGSKTQVTTMQGVWDALKVVASIVPNLNARAETPNVPNVQAPAGSTRPTIATTASAQVNDPVVSELRSGQTALQKQGTAQQETLEQIAADMAAMRANLERTAA